jgi:hypothetical protein
MNAKMRRNFSGAFLAHKDASGAWRLNGGLPHPVEVILNGVEAGAAQAFGAASIADIGIEWRPDAVLLCFVSGGKVQTVAAAAAIIHEPLGHLYESLPLMSFDAKARRFWQRVFRLVRMPGGRFLLKALTRSNQP